MQRGLGKVKQCLMLAASNPPPAGWATEAPPADIPTLQEPLPVKGTLFVVHAAAMDHMQEEIRRHFKPGTFRV